MKYLFFLIYILSTLCQMNAQSNSIIINEILVSNSSTNKNERGKYEDWIEIYNNTRASINLNGYYFTNDTTQPQKYKVTNDIIIHRNSHTIIWADGLDNVFNNNIHLNFKLRKKGGEIAIFHPDGKTLIHHLKFDKQYTNYSFGKDLTEEWLFFDQPTPGRANYKPGKNTPLKKVNSSVESGHYQKLIRVELSSKNHEAQIHYTTDGSTPTDSSKIYKEPIVIDQTTIIKTIAQLKHHYQSQVSTFFYHIDFVAPPLPIIHISIPNSNFRDIYTSSKHCSNNCHRKALITYISNNGKIAFETRAGIKISGKSSRQNDQKSIAITLRKDFDSKKINHDIFNIDSNYNVHSLVLRNGGNTWQKSFINDVLIQSFADELNIDHQKWQPVIAYINGQYWGIYHLREKINSRYLQYHHSLKSRKLDMVDESFKALKGSSQSYDELIKFVKENDLSNTKNYQKVIEQIDLENYIDYYTLEIFFANMDWPRRNVKVWKSEDTGKWRWILFDTDFGLKPSSRNFIKWAMGDSKGASPVLIKNGILFKALMANTYFKKTFIKRLNTNMNTTFSAQKIVTRIDSIEQLLKPEMPNHLNRWKHQCKKSYCIYNAAQENKGMELWSDHLEQLRKFAITREEYVLNDIIEIQ